MTDRIPDNSKRLAYAVGIVFHPAVVAIVTLLLVLHDLPLMKALVWTMLIGGIILIPTFMAIAYLRHQDRHTYQRKTRGSLYSMAWLSVIACFVLIWVANGPRELVVCMASLAIWLPLQLFINHFYTKISAHTAVISGCFMVLVLFGKLGSALILIGILAIILVGWARLRTRNHTIGQVLLGIALGSGSVLLVYPFLWA